MKISEWFYYKKGLKAIENEYGKPELIHLHVALPLGKFASHWSKKWKIPLILTEHWSIYTSYNKDLLTKKIVQKLAPIYKQVSGLTAVSQFLLDEIVCKFPVSVSKVIHNVVDTELFFPQQTNNSPKKILHISTLDERAKNFFGILKAVKLVSEKRQDFVLEVICEFRNLEAEKWIVENNLEKRVVFLGSMKEEKVAEVMKSCNFFLLFSNYETLSCVLLEAMSCGKAVITTPVGGIPEIMDTNRGVFVTPRNPAELAEKICFMLDNFEKFNPSEIRIYAETHFSKEIIGKQFDEFYKVALNIE